TLPRSLTQCVGTWSGMNGFRLMPTDPLHDAPATATVSLGAGGNLALVAYTWSHPTDGAQDGLLVLGLDDEDRVTAFWGDSWHQKPEPDALGGGVEGGVVAVGYEYAPGWHWAIVVDSTSAEALQIRMDNAVPRTEGEPYPVMIMDLRRS